MTTKTRIIFSFFLLLFAHSSLATVHNVGPSGGKFPFRIGQGGFINAQFKLEKGYQYKISVKSAYGEIRFVSHEIGAHRSGEGIPRYVTSLCGPEPQILKIRAKYVKISETSFGPNYRYNDLLIIKDNDKDHTKLIIEFKTAGTGCKPCKSPNVQDRCLLGEWVMNKSSLKTALPPKVAGCKADKEKITGQLRLRFDETGNVGISYDGIRSSTSAPKYRTQKVHTGTENGCYDVRKGWSPKFQAHRAIKLDRGTFQNNQQTQLSFKCLTIKKHSTTQRGNFATSVLWGLQLSKMSCDTNNLTFTRGNGDSISFERLTPRSRGTPGNTGRVIMAVAQYHLSSSMQVTTEIANPPTQLARRILNGDLITGEDSDLRIAANSFTRKLIELTAIAIQKVKQRYPGSSVIYKFTVGEYDMEKDYEILETTDSGMSYQANWVVIEAKASRLNFIVIK